jgi:dTDP-4-amino-4,6-dideoxygalactose transaminase
MLAKLKFFPEAIRRRRAIAQHYESRLSSVEQLTLPPPPVEDGDHFDVYQNYEIEAERRDALKAYLKEAGIGTIVQWGGLPLHRIETIGKDMIFDETCLERTDLLFSRSLLLPMNTSLSPSEIDYICDCIAHFYGKAVRLEWNGRRRASGRLQGGRHWA